ncbi:hypothetical protein Rhopal_002800-T1 [Rhodotorula paludigena]|uniref:Proteophosphoglycan ppg4 n=1 Tax=Rhodotorula paludigena TaxID=86838 RepID=A0AAV5GBI8_9BASI|nr:hypothetical protein Rhopal_002800-T1 [Rhodotorula paludigena]
MPGRLTRSLSRPFADLSNILKPRKPAQAKKSVSEDAPRLPTPPPLDLDLLDDGPLAPADDLADTADNSEDAPLPCRSSIESHQWKECTPILDDPVGEELAEQSISLTGLPFAAFQQQANDSADLSQDVFASREKCQRRVHSWHALDLAADEAVSEYETDSDADDSEQSRPPSSLANHVFPRESEDSSNTLSTPNTSFPSPTVEDDWIPAPQDIKGKGRMLDDESSSTQPTSTPPRPVPGFVELVETCPTPPSASTSRLAVGSMARRRSLLTAYDLDGVFDDELDASHGAPSASSSRAPSSLDHRVSSFIEDLPESERVHVLEPQFDSYSSSVYPDAAHFDTYTRRPRLRRSVTRLFAADDADALPFPDHNLVTSLLAHPRESTSHLPEPPLDDSPAVPSPPRHARPLPPPGLDTRYYPHPDALRASTSSPAHFSSLLSRATSPAPSLPLSHAHPRRRSVRPQPSAASLYTWDASHLPAPHSPREAPYRVSLASVLKPTALLGGGRGSGLYGDVWGAVERRAEPARTTTGRDGGRRRRSMPGGLGRSASRRSSWFGFGGATGDVDGRVEDHTIPEHAPYEPRGRADEDRIDKFAVRRPPSALSGASDAAESAGPGLLRRSLSRSLSRWSFSRRRSTAAGGPRSEQEDIDEAVQEAKARRRTSLALSVWSRKEERAEDETLDEWVTVVVR